MSLPVPHVIVMAVVENLDGCDTDQRLDEAADRHFVPGRAGTPALDYCASLAALSLIATAIRLSLILT